MNCVESFNQELKKLSQDILDLVSKQKHMEEENIELRAKNEKLENDLLELKDSLHERFLSWRGIEGPVCPDCNGSGKKVYGSTAAYKSGIGGQMITTSVCDRCWGSGEKDRPWRSWKEVDAILRNFTTKA